VPFGGQEADQGEHSRRNARDSRMRKKDYVSALETKVFDMEARDVALRAELAAVRSQLSTLQAEHYALLRRTGVQPVAH
jgi:hypothetical protein